MIFSGKVLAWSQCCRVTIRQQKMEIKSISIISLSVLLRRRPWRWVCGLWWKIHIVLDYKRRESFLILLSCWFFSFLFFFFWLERNKLAAHFTKSSYLLCLSTCLCGPGCFVLVCYPTNSLYFFLHSHFPSTPVFPKCCFFPSYLTFSPLALNCCHRLWDLHTRQLCSC